MTPTPPSKPADYVDQSGGENLRNQLQGMNNGVYTSLVTPDHTQAWDTDQLALQRKINDLAGQVGTGVDPQRITSPDPFESMSLAQIRAAVQAINPELVQHVSDAWEKIGTGLGDATTAVSARLKDTIVNSWQGGSAGNAAQSIGTFLDTSTKMGQASQLVGMKIAFAQRGSDETKRMLTPILDAASATSATTVLPGSLENMIGGLPVGSPSTSTAQIPTIAALGLGQDAQKQQDDAKQAAVTVLQNVYSPGLQGGDQGVPILPTVQQVVNPGGSVPSGSLGPGTTDPSTTTTDPSTTTTDPSTTTTDPSNKTDDSQQSSSTTDPSKQTTDSSTTTTDPSTTTTDASTTTTDPSKTTTAGLTPDSPSPGSPNSPGSPGSPSSPGGPGSPGSPASTPPGPGQVVPGAGVPAAATTAAAAARGATTGAAGTSGMMGQGAHGGKGEDDKEHKTSDLLRGQHLEEWIHGDNYVPAGDGVIDVQYQAPLPPDEPNPVQRSADPGEYR